MTAPPPDAPAEPEAFAAEARDNAVTAARNNAEWCAAVCRSHDVRSVTEPLLWSSHGPPPPYYPCVVTLQPQVTAADVLPRLDLGTPGCAVKDSFAALDLGGHGFTELFAAEWIHRPASPGQGGAAPLRVRPVTTAAALHRWQAAWHGGGQAPDVFRPALLAEPSVLVLAFHDGARPLGGAILYCGAGAVGVTNLVSVDPERGAEVWTTAVAAAEARFPGLPLVGYERGGDLGLALGRGFRRVGPLRVWHRTATG